MRKLNFIFVGGKNIGYETLNFLLKENFKPTFIVPNKDDNGRDNLFNKSVKKIAKKRGQTLPQMALAWVLRHSTMTSALIGARTVKQLDDCLDSLNNLEGVNADELIQLVELIKKRKY